MAVQGSSSPIVDATTQTEEPGECVPYAACPHASACPSILFSDSSAAMQQDGHPATFSTSPSLSPCVSWHYAVFHRVALP